MHDISRTVDTEDDDTEFYVPGYLAQVNASPRWQTLYYSACATGGALLQYGSDLADKVQGNPALARNAFIAATLGLIGARLVDMTIGGYHYDTHPVVPLREPD
jgi:hypothetical protein